MKKLPTLLLVIITSSVISMAQTVSFGAKAGINVANQKYESDYFKSERDARIGFHVGGFATIMFSETFGLQPELVYSSVGSKFKDGLEDIVSKWSYITVPVMIRYQPVKIFSIQAGPQVGFLLDAKYEGGGDLQEVEDTKSIELAAAFGAGIDLPVGVGFSVRYSLGLSNIADRASDIDFGDVITRNNVLQLSVTYRLTNNNN